MFHTLRHFGGKSHRSSTSHRHVPQLNRRFKIIRLYQEAVSQLLRHCGEPAQLSHRAIRFHNPEIPANNFNFLFKSIYQNTFRGLHILLINELKRVIGSNMSSTVPDTMRSLCVHSYRAPSQFEISSIPTPKISSPNHVIVKVAAAGINPADIELARGEFKLALTLP
jgi:hypothetical protein